MRNGIERFFGELPASIRAVVLCGNGTDFSAGFDLSMIANAASVVSLSRSCQRVLDRKPIPEFARFSKGGQRRLSARDRERDRSPSSGTNNQPRSTSPSSALNSTTPLADRGI
jgi:enoyl-CoA hydratase/carnithine racemase